MMLETQCELTARQIADLRLAARQMKGAARRRFQAEMTLKYCGGSARKGESILAGNVIASRPV